MKNETKKKAVNKINKKLVIPFVFISVISFIAYIIIELIYDKNLYNSMLTILSMIILLLFMVCFTIISLKNDNKKCTPFIIVGSLLIFVYSAFNILSQLNIIGSRGGYVLNFYNTPVTEVYSWRMKNDVLIKETYEYSDTIPIYHVIAQDVNYMTPTKSIREINLIISLGPNYEKELVVPSFMGWQYDKVIKYLEDNYLSNVEINFQESSNLENTVIFQEGSGTRKRNELIKITFCRNEIIPIEIIDFTNKSLLYSTSWLKKYGFKYEIDYQYDDNISENHVIKQSVVPKTDEEDNDSVLLTISKGKMIKAPDFTKMTQDEINKWIMNNNLKVNYNEVYNDAVSLGDVISSNVIENDIIDTGSIIDIVISKGRLEMISLDDIDYFTSWAMEYNIKYSIKYEYSETISANKIISSSHQSGDVIKDDDVINILISKGKSVIIPNLVGMSKSNIQTKCSELKLICNFVYGEYTESTKKDISLKQSKKKGLIVSENTNVVITLSSGLYTKVNVPSFTGKTKSAITTSCKKLGITCKFTYQSNYSSNPLDTCVSQSKVGSIIQGSTITITLSKGPAITYNNIIIDVNQLSPGNPSASKATLEKKLADNCPGVKFVYKFQTARTAIGYLAEESDVKIGRNSFTQGRTYNVIINSN